jgi:hypothetical protein
MGNCQRAHGSAHHGAERGGGGFVVYQRPLDCREDSTVNQILVAAWMLALLAVTGYGSVFDVSWRLWGTNAFSARKTLLVKKPIETERREQTGHAAESTQSSTLAKGQIWRTGENYVLIGDRGKRLIQYKVATKLNQRGLRIQMASAESVQAFLNAKGAELITS